MRFNEGLKGVLSEKEVKERLTRWMRNPILSPSGNRWENMQTFNPGVVLLDERVHVLYRAIGEDWVSRVGYASSRDGFNIDERLPYPVYEHRWSSPFASSNITEEYFSGGGAFGVEDPRLVKMKGEDRVYMTYTFYDGRSIGIMLTAINANDLSEKRWNWKVPILLSPPDQPHKNWVLFPEKIEGKYAILHSLSPEIGIAYLDSLDEPGPIQSYYRPVPRDTWDRFVRGAAAPPIRTDPGWLLLYHATGDDGYYRVGAMIMDIDDPTKMLYRSRAPLLGPKEHYEFSGFKPGVTYVTGAVVKDSKLLVYYGAADTHVCVAYTNLDELLDYLTK
ncbi:MAG: hypothetical protein QXI20_01470 [Candidatus Jordarchaeales archaeon]